MIDTNKPPGLSEPGHTTRLGRDTRADTAARNAGWLIDRGELTAGRTRLLRSLVLAGPGLGWLLLFLVLPLVLVSALAFADRGEHGEVIWRFTWDNVQRLAGFGILGWSADFPIILWRSLWLAAVATAIALVLAYPLAFAIAAQRPAIRYMILSLVAIPFCTNLVIRTYGWMLLLSGHLPLAGCARWLGLVGPDEALYPGPFAVILGTVNAIIPFAILPLYPSVERLDWSLVEAARDCYASPWRVFRHAIVPQTANGLMAAFVLTFIPTVGMYVIADLLGGAKYMLVGNLIQQQFFSSRNWPLGAAVCVGLILLTFVGLLLLRRSIVENRR